jgi:PRC-barrel domain protein
MCRSWRPAIARPKVIGSAVVNDKNETIGKIDDLLVSLDGKQPYAVLSIGGFLPWALTWSWCRTTR